MSINIFETGPVLCLSVCMYFYKTVFYITDLARTIMILVSLIDFIKQGVNFFVTVRISL